MPARAERLEPAADWLDRCRAMWEEQLDRLDVYMKSVAPQPAAPAPAPETTKRKTAREKPETRRTKGERNGLER